MNKWQIICPLVAMGIFVVAAALIVGSRQQNSYRVSIKRACINNLKVLHAAKESWAMENHKATNDTPSAIELLMVRGAPDDIPECPAGGVYQVGKVGVKPTCTVDGHSL